MNYGNPDDTSQRSIRNAMMLFVLTFGLIMMSMWTKKNEPPVPADKAKGAKTEQVQKAAPPSEVKPLVNAALTSAAASGTLSASGTVVVTPLEKMTAIEVAARVADTYRNLNSYKLDFTMVQLLQANNKQKESMLEKMTNNYRLYCLDRNPADPEKLIRLEFLRGLNQKTVIVLAPGKKSQDEVTVYKPSGKVRLKPEDLRVKDIGSTPLGVFAENLAKSIQTSSPAATVEYKPAANRLIIQTTDEKNQVVTYIDSRTFSFQKQDVFAKGKKDTVLFKQSIEWKKIEPVEGMSEADITRVPKF